MLLSLADNDAEIRKAVCVSLRKINEDPNERILHSLQSNLKLEKDNMVKLEMEKTINHFQQKENQFEDQQQQPSQSAYSEKNTSQSEPKPDVISSQSLPINPKKRQLPTSNGNAPTKKQKANLPNQKTTLHNFFTKKKSKQANQMENPLELDLAATTNNNEPNQSPIKRSDTDNDTNQHELPHPQIESAQTDIIQTKTHVDEHLSVQQHDNQQKNSSQSISKKYKPPPPDARIMSLSSFNTRKSNIQANTMNQIGGLAKFQTSNRINSPNIHRNDYSRSFSSNAFNNIVSVTSTTITYEVAQNSAENVTPTTNALNSAIPENINSTVCIPSTPTNNTTPDTPISISIPISGYQSRLLSTPTTNPINDQFSSTPIIGPISSPMTVVTKKKQRTPKFYDDEQIVLTSEQQNILNFALNGKSLFFTGAAGTGKVIEQLIGRQQKLS